VATTMTDAAQTGETAVDHKELNYKMQNTLQAALAGSGGDDSNMIELMFNCAEVHALLMAMASYIKACSDKSVSGGSGIDVGGLKRAYSRTKAALVQAKQGTDDTEASVEWFFTRGDIKMFLAAADTKMKSLTVGAACNNQSDRISTPVRDSGNKLALETPPKISYEAPTVKDEDEVVVEVAATASPTQAKLSTSQAEATRKSAQDSEGGVSLLARVADMQDLLETQKKRLMSAEKTLQEKENAQVAMAREHECLQATAGRLQAELAKSKTQVIQLENARTEESNCTDAELAKLRTQLSDAEARAKETMSAQQNEDGVIQAKFAKKEQEVTELCRHLASQESALAATEERTRIQLGQAATEIKQVQEHGQAQLRQIKNEHDTARALVERLEADAARQAERVDAQSSELADALKTAGTAEDQRLDSERTQQTLQSELASLQEEMNKLRGETDVGTARAQEVEPQLALLREETCELRASVDHAHKTLRLQAEDAAAELKEAKAKLQSLSGELHTEQEHHVTLTAALKEELSSAQKHSRAAELRATETMSDQRSKDAIIQAKLKETEQEVLEVCRKMACQKSALIAAEERTKTELHEVARLKQASEHDQAQQTRIKNELDSARILVKTLEADAASHAEKVNTESATLATALKATLAAEERCSDSDSIQKTLRSELSSIQEEMQTLRCETNSRIATMCQELTAARRHTHELEEQEAATKTMHAVSQEDMAQKSMKLSSLKTQLQSSEEHRERLHTELNAAAFNRSRIESHLCEAEAEVSEMKGRLDGANAELRAAQTAAHARNQSSQGSVCGTSSEKDAAALRESANKVEKSTKTDALATGGARDSSSSVKKVMSEGESAQLRTELEKEKERLIAVTSSLQATRKDLAAARSKLVEREDELAEKEEELEHLRSAPQSTRGRVHHGRGAPPRKRARTTHGSLPKGENAEVSGQPSCPGDDGDDEVLVRESFMTRGSKRSRQPFVKQVSRWVGADYEVCWNFVKTGVCRRGSQCRWRHPPPNKPDWTKVSIKKEPVDD